MQVKAAALEAYLNEQVVSLCSKLAVWFGVYDAKLQKARALCLEAGAGLRGRSKRNMCAVSAPRTVPYR
jgi:hypothetical protein